MSEDSIPAQIPDWVQDHLRLYIATDGAEGHMWDSAFVGGPGPLPTLLLTTRGRRSGMSRIVPLLYGKTQEGYVVVASKGGAPAHPNWYLNLAVQPEVQVQIESKRFQATARVAAGPDRLELWSQMVGMYPPYADYQARTEREIPIVVLVPARD